ncbi:MAG: uroporphyrinogen decarboxylase family protein [Candidatus Brocadiia bacterium]
MTPYEIVRRAIEFDKPKRIPIRLGTIGFDDCCWVGWKPPENWEARAENVDEWGCRWERPTTVQNMGQVKGHPLEDWRELENYLAPDPHIPSRFRDTEEQLQEAGEKYVVIGCGFTLFERMYYLRGYQNLLTDFYTQPKRVDELAEKVVQFPIGIAEEVGKRFRGRIHGFAMTDDWGTQQQSTISIPMWRRFFKERYRRLFDAIHDAGMHAWMHSCGKVNEVIEEWVDVGLDVVNLQQPTLLGIKEIGQRYRGRICFETLCDIQKTLPGGSPEEIRAEARELLKEWATSEGGFILSDYGDGAAIGAADEQKQIMWRAFTELAAPELEGLKPWEESGTVHPA